MKRKYLNLEERDLDFTNKEEVYEFLLGTGHTEKEISTYAYMISEFYKEPLDVFDRFIESKRKPVLNFLRNAGLINYEVKSIKDYYYLDGGKELYILNSKHWK